MATNKNQHFVPRCYLRPFTQDSANSTINLFNIDRLKFIEKVSVRHQCSRNYFYGEDPNLEKAIQLSESNYAAVLRDILKPRYSLKESHQILLLRFWLLQFMRTEAASKRAVEMNENLLDFIGAEQANFKLEIREAVQNAMHAYVKYMHAVDDLKVRLIRNKTSIPFITSDDPAVLTNRWYLTDPRALRGSFGINSAGNILILPLSPKVLFLGFDSDVYSIPHKSGWVDVRKVSDILAFNQHQFLNCRANIFINDPAYARGVQDEFNKIKHNRPKARHEYIYAVQDKQEGGYERYKIVERALADDHEKAMVHTRRVHARPNAWPMQLQRRSKGVVYTNDTGVGYVRRFVAESGIYQDMRKEYAYKKK